MRRGNKSHKVPNVKLRPAQEAGSSSQAISRRSSQTVSRQSSPQDWFIQDTQANTSVDMTGVGSCPRPFKGVMLCATGIEDKPTLFKQAVELGALTSHALTDRVTHLIAGDCESAKYQCAVARKIPIMKPSWVTDCYATWVKGDDVDFDRSITEHRLPTFSGVILCTSGIDDVPRRVQIHRHITSQGGNYVKVLERPVKVTHLLCSGDEQTDKMRYAEKFNRTGEARIHLVWEEWFWDSLEHGGRWDETKYEVKHPRPVRKASTSKDHAAEIPSKSPAPLSVSTNRSSAALPHQATPSSSVGAQPLLPRETAAGQHAPPSEEEDEEEIVSVKRVPAVTLQVWQGLLKPRGFEVSAGKLVRIPSQSPHLQDAALPQLPVIPEGTQKAEGRLMPSFSRANSFAQLPRPAAAAQHGPFRRCSTLPGAFALPDTDQVEIHLDSAVVGPPGTSSFLAAPPAHSNTKKLSSVTSEVFTGLRFRALGEARDPVVRRGVESLGGCMVTDDDDPESVDYIIVRLVSGSKFYRLEPEPEQREKYRTECWLEQCIFSERICSPDEHVCFRPLTISTPIPGAEAVTMGYSGLDQSEACWVRRLIRALGMNLVANFSRSNTHLLCPSRAGQKFKKAMEWGVPVIDMQWLSRATSTGVIPGSISSDIEKQATPCEENRPEYTEAMHDAPLDERPQVANVKGKEKASELSAGNNCPPETIKCMTSPVVSKEDSIPSSQKTEAEQSQPFRPTMGSFNRRSGLLGPPTMSPKQLINEEARDSLQPEVAPSNPGNTPIPEEPRCDIQDEARVPSSTSPSPIKLAAHPAVPSPVRISSQVTKALQEGLTTLLGKRQNAPDNLPGPHPKAGKRARRQRSKPVSRHMSDGHGGLQPAPIPSDDDATFNPFDVDELNLIDGEARVTEDSSVRVTYEDPDQADEKKRLMSIFASQLDDNSGRENAQPDGSSRKAGSGSKVIRRSTRIAGF